MCSVSAVSATVAASGTSRPELQHSEHCLGKVDLHEKRISCENWGNPAGLDLKFGGNPAGFDVRFMGKPSGLDVRNSGEIQFGLM